MPLLVARCYGFVGYLRLQVEEHTGKGEREGEGKGKGARKKAFLSSCLECMSLYRVIRCLCIGDKLMIYALQFFAGL